MLPIPERIVLASGVTDFRKSIDELVALNQESIGCSPYAPTLFAFCNRQPRHSHRQERSPAVAKSIIMESRTEQVAALKLQVAWYEVRFRRAQHKRIGASSEQTHPDKLTLFNEAESEADPELLPVK